MYKSIINIIEDYIRTQSRNKLIFHSQRIPLLESINVGQRISESIYKFEDPSRIAMRVSTELGSVLNAAISNHESFGKYLSIENLGILFEPELKIDIVGLLDSFSQNNALFVRWEGAIDPGKLYFLTREDGIELNIKNLSHIIV